MDWESVCLTLFAGSTFSLVNDNCLNGTPPNGPFDITHYNVTKTITDNFGAAAVGNSAGLGDLAHSLERNSVF
jgi:hypothetical protein